MRRGVLEGFFGSPWPTQERLEALPFLAAEGYDLYVYAPKADRHLRGRWSERHPPEVEADLRALVEAGERSGVDIAVGLSPLALVARWGHDGPATLNRRVGELRDLGLHGLGVFFDDMRGDVPDLATTQAAMVRCIRDAHPDLPLWMCPTYYTPHAVLDRVFGERPERYLETLGAGLPPDVEVFWTGEKVCSTSYTADHLRSVTERLGRRVAIWDNYPVNDGPRMCKHLHLRPPFGRPPDLAAYVSTWCVNPMNQPHASRVAIAAIAAHLDGRETTLTALGDRLYGHEITAALTEWIDRFQDQGLDGMDEATRAHAIQRFTPFERHDRVAQEIVAWLRGETIVGPECLTDTED